MAGCYRFVSTNGMICGDTYDEVRVTHRGDIQNNVIEGAWRILDHSQAITESRQTMQTIALNETEQQVLRRKRMADTDTDLWVTFNVSSYIGEPTRPPQIASAHAPPVEWDTDFDQTSLLASEQAEWIPEFEYDQTVNWRHVISRGLNNRCCSKVGAVLRG